MKVAPPKYQNQRLLKPGRQRKQQHLLEVSIRRDRERAIRFKAASLFVFKFVAYSALLAGLVVGSREGFRRYVWENPDFFLDDTRVHTDGTLTREQILTAAGVTPTMNFFQLSPSKVREQLEHLPQVEHVELERGLPNKLSIEISERQPIAWLTDRADFDPATVEGSFLIDARGYVMTSRKRRLDFIHLPVISGVVLEDFAPGQKATALEIQAALELIRLNADSMRWQVRTVDIAKGFCLVVTDRSRARITFGLDDMDRQLTRLYRIMDYVEPSHREIQTVNLLVERNTPVTFTDEPEPPEVATPVPEPAKPADKAKAKLAEPATTAHAVGGFTKPDEKKATATPAPKRRSSDEEKPRETAPRKSRSDDRRDSDEERRRSNDSVKKPFRAHG